MWDTARDSRMIADLDVAISIVEAHDGVGVLTYCNAAFQRMSGYSLAELEGRKMRILRGPDNDPAEIATLNAAIRTGSECRVTIQNLRKDGIPYWNVICIRAVRNATGQISYFVGEHRDVTETKRIEAGLDLNERYLSILGGLTQDGVFHRDLDGRLTFANQSYFDISGLQSADTSLADLVRCVHPDDRWKFRDWPSEFAHVGGRIEEMCFLRPNGDVTWALVRTAPLLAADGKIRGLVGVVKDVTSQKRSDQAARETAQLIKLDLTAIIQLDLEQRPILWNESAKRLYGWTRAEASEQPSLAFLHSAEGIARFEDAWRHVLQLGSWEGELVRVRKDGRPVTVRASWGVVRNANGQLTSVLCSETEHLQARGLTPQTSRAQRLESIGEMASGVAHDLNNVLQPIMMTLDMLDEMVVDPKQRQWLSLASQSATRGAELLRGVLTFARGGEETRAVTSVASIVTEAAKIMRGAFPPDITVTLTTARDVRRVMADPTQIHQLVMNLAINARDAMPHGGTLSLSTENLMADATFCRSHPGAVEGAYVLLRVADTGVGIPPDIREKIFTPYFSTKVEAGGTGIGLSTVESIVKAHGGFITVHSEVGAGTAFSVFLPATTIAGTTAQELADEEGALVALEGHGERILLVDDESTLREIALQTLERHGYRVIVARSPREALNLMQSDIPIDLVLTDLLMPGDSGQSLIAELRSAAPTVRIIAMSGLDRRDSDPSLGVPFLLKPFSSRALLEALHATLQAPLQDAQPRTV